MTNERWREIELSPEATLTRDEMKEGWHFCMEFDYLCTQGEMFLDEEELICLCGFDKRKVE